MARRKRTQTRPARAERAQGGSSLFGRYADLYFEESRKPLAALLFLLPLIVLYEVLLYALSRSSGGLVVPSAHRWILTLFEAFQLGTFGLWLPGVLVVGVLVIWHSLERRDWKADPAVVGLMWSESIVLAIPLFVFSQAALRIPAAALADGAVTFDSLPLAGRIAVSVGAGIYEELIFRLALIGVLLVCFEDVLKTGRRFALVASIGLGAIAFMAYHPLRGASGAVLPSRVVFYLVAGVYFGVLFVVRGFGIAVGAHAFYDIFSALVATSGAHADLDS